jgi:hypothetical protein
MSILISASFHMTLEVTVYVEGTVGPFVVAIHAYRWITVPSVLTSALDRGEW